MGNQFDSMKENTVMGIFKSFETKKTPNVKLTKIGCVDGHIPKIPIGQVVKGIFASEVEVGLSFNIANAKIIEGGSDSKLNLKGVEYEYWCTSIIQKILTDNTFQTKNSIYKWEIIS